MGVDQSLTSGAHGGSPLRVGILGATGAVGQKFIKLLSGHPWSTTPFGVLQEEPS
jgi:N-acetyl-gamma-glutamylphosphate reductase